MLRIICKYYPKAYKYPQTRISFIMIGHNDWWTPVDKM